VNNSVPDVPVPAIGGVGDKGQVMFEDLREGARCVQISQRDSTCKFGVVSLTCEGMFADLGQTPLFDGHGNVVLGICQCSSSFFEVVRSCDLLSFGFVFNLAPLGKRVT
jgi:hypothetical protein